MIGCPFIMTLRNSTIWPIFDHHFNFGDPFHLSLQDDILLHSIDDKDKKDLSAKLDFLRKGSFLFPLLQKERGQTKLRTRLN